MNSEPDWTLYRTFLTVAKLGSLSAAARSLGLTQPTVARHIESLEGELEVDLFLRSPRGLSPTDIALALLPQAEAIAASASTLLRTAASGKGEMTGSVRVSASEVMGVERLPPILAALRRAQEVVEARAHHLFGQGAPGLGWLCLAARQLAPIALGIQLLAIGVDVLGQHGLLRGDPQLAPLDQDPARQQREHLIVLAPDVEVAPADRRRVEPRDLRGLRSAGS